MLMRSLSVFLTLILLSTVSQAESSYSALKRAGAAEYWLKLLHYEDSAFGGYRSLVDSPYFFLHPEGKSSPEKELEATLDILNQPGAKAGFFGMHPQCVFVERYRLLKQIGLIKSKDLPCQEFTDWRDAIGAKSIVLVYSASFPNNPASVFGHTFIRFKKGEQNSLLDYSASYAAFTGTDSMGVLYAIKGLIGAYKGGFSVAPYYIQVNKYINSESRDLYEYELAFSKEGVERIVNHLWELYSSAYFYYYFLDENCSYILARLLELGDPKWNLTDPNRWYYLPNDSIKLARAIDGSVKNTKYRPSLKKQLAAHWKNLTSEEKELFSRGQKSEEALEEIDSIKVMDALVKSGNFSKMKKKSSFSQEDKKQLRAFLLRRSQLGAPSELIKVPLKETMKPEYSHDPSKVSIGIGSKNNSSTRYQFTYNIGKHDLMSSDNGLEPYSQIGFFDATLTYDSETEEVDLTRLKLLDIISLHQLTVFDPRFSWKLGIGYDQVEDLQTADCGKYDADFGLGVSANPGTEAAILYILSGVYAETAECFEKSSRYGLFVDLAAIGNPIESYKVMLKQGIRADANEGMSDHYYLTSTFENAYSWGRNWEVRLISRWVSRNGSLQVETVTHDLKLGYYF